MRDFQSKRSPTSGRDEAAAAAEPGPGKRTLTEVLSPASSPVQRKLDSASAMPTGPQPPIAGLFGRGAERQHNAGPEAASRPTIFELFGASVQRKASGAELNAEQIHASAQRGIATAASPLPYADRIQRSFGWHNISSIKAHTGGKAAAAAREMGAQAYATGHDVVLGPEADLHTVAHEAAHVVQQRVGVHLRGGIGEAGDPHERHADAVADQVVQGNSAESLLDQYSGDTNGIGNNAGRWDAAVQRAATAMPAEDSAQVNAAVAGGSAQQVESELPPDEDPADFVRGDPKQGVLPPPDPLPDPLDEGLEPEREGIAENAVDADIGSPSPETTPLGAEGNADLDMPESQLAPQEEIADGEASPNEPALDEEAQGDHGREPDGTSRGEPTLAPTAMAPIQFGKQKTRKRVAYSQYKVLHSDIGNGTDTNQKVRDYVNGGGAPRVRYFTERVRYINRYGIQKSKRFRARNPRDPGGRWDAGHRKGRQMGGSGTHVSNIFAQNPILNRQNSAKARKMVMRNSYRDKYGSKMTWRRWEDLKRHKAAKGYIVGVKFKGYNRS